MAGWPVGDGGVLGGVGGGAGVGGRPPAARCAAAWAQTPMALPGPAPAGAAEHGGLRCG